MIENADVFKFIEWETPRFHPIDGTRPDLDRISVGRGEIVDDLGDVGVVDRRARGLDHFRHFGLPESCLNFGPRGWV